jgi:Tannase and feruloyl esterase
MWPQLVMEWNNDFLPACKENLVNTTLQSHCRDQDGQVDGVFDPRTCDVLAILHRLIGTVTPCGTFTTADALVVQEIWQGPRFSGSQKNLLTGLPVWFGLEPGADLAGAYVPALGPGGGLGLATTHQLASGQWAGAPFIPSADWFQNWIKQDPGWVFTDETYQQYWQDFAKSGQMFDTEIAAANPDLHAFKADGGKLIMWQGLADQLIFTGDSISYYNRALAANGGIRDTESFFRYFLAPGVAHCGAPGPGSIAPDAAGHQLGRDRPGTGGPGRQRHDQRPVRDPAPVPLPRRGRDLHRREPRPGRQLHLPHFSNPFLLNGQHR